MNKNLMLKKKHIHIFDDEKFVDPAIKLLEEVSPGTSHYYVNKLKDVPFAFVKSTLVERINFEDLDDRKGFYNYLNSNINYIIFFHALNHFKQEIVLNIDVRIKKVWFIWGYDLYLNWPLLEKNIYLPATKSIVGKEIHFKTKLLNSSLAFFLFRNHFILKFVGKNILGLLNDIFNTHFYKAANRIDFIVPIVPTECKFINEMRLKAQIAPFAYSCLEDLLGENINETIYGKSDIIVGNSADPSNNHLDIFMKLSKLNLEGRKIYVPLSYSGNIKYKDAVIEQGYKLFKEKFYPLTEYMSLEKYNKVLLNCGVIILNHVRQQAVGNIVSMGYLGAKIYLNSKSPVYKYFTEEGVVIEDFNKIKDVHFQQSYSLSIMKKNKQIFYDLYSRESVHAKINKMLKIVTVE